MIAGRRASARGLTLLEVMVSIGILAIVGSLIYGAFDGMRRSRETIIGRGDRYHEGRSAIGRMSRELAAAFISLNRPGMTNGQMATGLGNVAPIVRQTLFVGRSRHPIDRIDFTSMSHLRTGRGTHESDQNELSYFGSRDPETGAIDLVRRVSANLDEDAQHGGVVQVMVRDVASVDFAFLDPISNTWVEDWSSLESAGQAERLPAQVKIVLELNQGAHDKPLVFMTKVTLGMQVPIGMGDAQATISNLLGGDTSGLSTGTGSTGSGGAPFGGRGSNPFAAGPGGTRAGTR